MSERDAPDTDGARDSVDAAPLGRRIPLRLEGWDPMEGTEDEESDAERPTRMGSRAAGASTAQVKRNRRSSRHGLAAAIVALGGIATLVAAAAAVALRSEEPADRWTPVLQDVLTTAYQGLVLGALGGLAKLLIDRRRDAELAASQLRDRQLAFIDSVIQASHQLDTMRVRIPANRSVKTWTEAMTGTVVVAWISLRDLAHDLTNARQAHLPLFDESVAIEEELDRMCDELWLLIVEHAEHKQRLAELQREAGALTGKDRRRQLDVIWRELEALEHLADFIAEAEYDGQFRVAYLTALQLMRAALGQPVPARTS